MLFRSDFAPLPADEIVGCEGVPQAQSELIPPVVQEGPDSNPSVYGNEEMNELHCEIATFTFRKKVKKKIEKNLLNFNCPKNNFSF